MELNGRKHRILTAIVRAYIRTGEPVGSKALMDETDLNVSSATIRNEMSDLERMGYLCKPHTSAGRVPSNEGYKYYVETSMDQYALTTEEQQGLDLSHKFCGFYETVREACTKLAAFSECTAFVVTPSCHDGIFTFEVLPAGKKTIAILAVGTGGSVKTGFAKTENDLTAEEAATLADILNQTLSRFPVNQIGKVRMMLLESELKKHGASYASVTATVNGLIEQIKSYELTIIGGSNLLSYPEFSDIETARQFIDTLSERDRVLQALLSGHEDTELTIRIGNENRVFSNSEASLIRLECDSKIPLVVGIIGPKRMDYARMTAGCRFLVGMLKNIINEEY